MDSSKRISFLSNKFPPTETSEWLSAVEKDLKGSDYEKTLVWKTDENIDIQPFYRQEHISHLGELVQSIPGEFPFARGINKEKDSWKINVRIRHQSADNANEAAINAINNGADSVTFSKEVFDRAKNIEPLLTNINLKNTLINFETEEQIDKKVKLISKYLQSKNEVLNGSFFLDPLKTLIIKGDDKDLESAITEIKEAILLCDEYMPFYRIFTIHSYPFKSSGGNIVQELAFTLNAAVEYITKLTNIGLDIDSICKRIKFSFSIGSSYFMEIAKLRAARLLWGKIVEHHNPANEESCKMNIHAHTAHFNKTVYDPYVNILRGTTETMAAAIGGANSITVTPFDACYKNSDHFSERVARNTQLITRHEAFLDKVKDPGGGSYYIEKLTESISEEALKLFKEVEKNGGFIESLKKGLIQERITKSRSVFEEKSHTREKAFLGTNHYPNPEEKMPGKMEKTDSTTEEMADNKANPDIQPLKTFRGSEQFEKLRFKTEKYSELKGHAPKVFLLQLGDLRKRRARANFSYNLFGCAGFEIVDNSGFDTTESGVKSALESKADIVVICSSNDEYPDLVPEAVRGLREKKPEQIIVVAGYSKTLLENLKNCKIDDFIHTGTNAVEFLNKYMKILELEQG